MLTPTSHVPPSRARQPKDRVQAAGSVDGGDAEFEGFLEYFMYNHRYPQPMPNRRRSALGVGASVAAERTSKPGDVGGRGLVV